MTGSVLAINPGHDGAIAFIADGRLITSIEAEKDSFDRNGSVTASLLDVALRSIPGPPDVIAVGGWHKMLPGPATAVGAGYLGLEPGVLEPTRLFGRAAHSYSSSHERSHVFGGVAMSPFDTDEDIAVLVWEGVIGSLYLWQDGGRTITRWEVMSQPGSRYAALFALADPSVPDGGTLLPSSLAGKLMALAGFSDGAPLRPDSCDVLESLLRTEHLNPFDKGRYRRSDLHNCGVTDPELCRAARQLSDRIFGHFRDAAARLLPTGLPLVIAGGCGLNCDWNVAWEQSGLFSEVFVPPCANDSGSAIGTAVDAWTQQGGRPHLDWNVYSGPEFVDQPAPEQWSAAPIDIHDVSRRLDQGGVVAWIQGNCEIGPRALGHRSLLASASRPETRDLLNCIKQREGYRPIAPVCLEEDLGRWFDRDDPDPYMLRFRTVLERSALPAVTHADGTARVQSVTADSVPPLHRLLRAHREQTGVGVLCNTSLNFPGKGFINRSQDLFSYCETTGIRTAVIGDVLYTRSCR